MFSNILFTSFLQSFTIWVKTLNFIYNFVRMSIDSLSKRESVNLNVYIPDINI